MRRNSIKYIVLIAIIFSLFSGVFAYADEYQTVGEELKTIGIIKGKSGGDLDIYSKLSREDSIVILTRMMGKEREVIASVEAVGYADINTGFVDVPKNSYAAPYIIYARNQGWTKGVSDTEFGFGRSITTKECATLMLRSLGISVNWKTEDAIKKAVDKGILNGVAAGANDAIIRGDIFLMMKNTLYSKPLGSRGMLVDNLGLIEKPVLKPTIKDLVLSAVAVANNQVEVILKNHPGTSKLNIEDFVLTLKGDYRPVAVKYAALQMGKTVLLTTEALHAGFGYTINGINFTAIARDTNMPTVKRVQGIDSNKFNVEFSTRLDFTSATDPANYTMSAGLKVLNVELSEDRRSVDVYTDKATMNKSYTITVENLLSTDGYRMERTSRPVVAFEDRTAPKIMRVYAQNEYMIIIKFDDANGINKEVAENVNNYIIADLLVNSAQAFDTSDDGRALYDTVVLRTEKQKAGKSYTVEIREIADNSITVNKMATTRRDFMGASQDTQGPVVKVSPYAIISENNNVIKILFEDSNALNKESVENVANYMIMDSKGDVLPVLSATCTWGVDFPDGYDRDKKGVTLITAQQLLNTQYLLEVRGIKDEFGNELRPVAGSSYQKYPFTASKIELAPPFVEEIIYVDNKTIRIVFSKDVSNTVNDPTNFSIDGGLGQAIKSKYVDGARGKNVIELTVPEMTPNTNYIVTIYRIIDDYGNEAENIKAKYIATRQELDLTPPNIAFMYAPSRSEVQINFTKPIYKYPAKIILRRFSNGVFDVNDAGIELTYKGYLNNRKTLVYTTTSQASRDNMDNYTYRIDFEHPSMIGYFIDEAGNRLSMSSTTGSAVLVGTRVANSNPLLSEIIQDDVKSLKVRFNKPVKGTGAQSNYFAYVDEKNPDAFGTEIMLKLKGDLQFSAGKEISIDFTTLVEDFCGDRAMDKADIRPDDFVNVTRFVPYMSDDVKPYIVSVQATSANSIAITYSEPMDTNMTGNYKIYYYNDSQRPVTVGAFSRLKSVNQEKTILEIDLGEAYLSPNTNYVLEPAGGARDIAGNFEIVGEKYEFAGSSIVVTNYIEGLKIINAGLLRVEASREIKTKNVDDIKVYIVDDSKPKKDWVNIVRKVTPYTPHAEVDIGASLELEQSVLADKIYQVEVTFANGTIASKKFSGIARDLGLRATRVSDDTISFDYLGIDNNLYQYRLVRGANSTDANQSYPVPIDASNISNRDERNQIARIIGNGINTTTFPRGVGVCFEIYSRETGALVYSVKVVPQ